MSGTLLLILRILAALALYAFLGWALLALWKDLRQHGSALLGRKVPPLSLVLLTPGGKPVTRHFLRPEITIGRDPACECILDDDAVSGLHARFSHHHGQWWVEDMDSTNGTLLNQQPLTMPTIVIAEDEITCGSTRLTVGLAVNPLEQATRPLQEPVEKE